MRWCSYVCSHVVWLCSAECSHGTCVYMMLCFCSTMCLYGAVVVFSCVFIWCCSYVQLCVHMVIRCWAMCFYSTVAVPSVCLYCNMMFFCVCLMALCWLCLVLCLYSDMTHVLSRTWVPHLLVMASYLWFDFFGFGVCEWCRTCQRIRKQARVLAGIVVEDSFLWAMLVSLKLSGLVTTCTSGTAYFSSVCKAVLSLVYLPLTWKWYIWSWFNLQF